MLTRYQLLTWPANDDQCAEVDPTLYETADAAVEASGVPLVHWVTHDDGCLKLHPGYLEIIERRNFAMIVPCRSAEDDSERVAAAVDLLLDLGQTEGEWHKAWVIDQTLRILLGDRYFDAVARYCAGEDGPETYEWDHGTAP